MNLSAAAAFHHEHAYTNGTTFFFLFSSSIAILILSSSLSLSSTSSSLVLPPPTNKTSLLYKNTSRSTKGPLIFTTSSGSPHPRSHRFIDITSTSVFCARSSFARVRVEKSPFTASPSSPSSKSNKLKCLVTDPSDNNITLHADDRSVQNLDRSVVASRSFAS